MIQISDQLKFWLTLSKHLDFLNMYYGPAIVDSFSNYVYIIGNMTTVPSINQKPINFQ